MLRYANLRLDELELRHRQFWNLAVSQVSQFQSPYFSYEYCAAFATIGQRVEVFVVEDGDEVRGIQPFQRDHWNIARPVGGSLSDYQGFLTADLPRLPWQIVLRMCRLRGWQATAFLPTDEAPGIFRVRPAPYLNLAQGFDAYCHARKQSGSATVEKTLRKARRLARETNCEFELRNDTARMLHLLLGWKARQYERKEVNIHLYQRRVPDLCRYWLECRTDSFEGMVSVLWANDEPAAIGYSLRNHGIAHCCFVGHAERFSAYSPGLILLLQLAEKLSAEGVRELHLGLGDERFKTSLASDCRYVAEGIIGATRLQTHWFQTCHRFYHRLKQLPVAPWLRRVRAVFP